MRKKFLTAAIATFAVSITAGLGVTFANKDVPAAFAASITYDFSSSTLNGWTVVSGVNVTGGVASFSANGRMATNTTYSNFTMTFKVTDRTNAFYLLLGRSTTDSEITSGKYIQFNTDRALPCESGGTVSSDSAVVDQWVNGSDWTLTVYNGTASLSSEGGTVCTNWSIGTTSASYVIFESLGTMNLDDVVITSSEIAEDIGGSTGGSSGSTTGSTEGTLVQGFETVRIATGTTGVASVETSTEHVTEGTYSNAVTTTATWFQIDIDLGVTSLSSYTTIQFDYYLTNSQIRFYSPVDSGDTVLLAKSGTYSIPVSNITLNGSVCGTGVGYVCFP